MDSPAIELDGAGAVYRIQGSTTTLYDPQNNVDPDIRELLTN